MKKFLSALVIAAAVAIPLSGCSSPAPAPQPTVTVTAPAPERFPSETSSGVDRQYLDAVRSKSAVLYSVPDSMLLDIAQSICQSLRAGVPIQTVLQTGLDSGLDSTSVAAIAAGSVVFYCPDADPTLSGGTA